MADPQIPYSPYLQAALAKGSPQPAPAPNFAPSPQQIQQFMQQKNAWEAANPGQSYLMHNLQQAGSNLINAPGRVIGGAESAVQGIGHAFGQLGGLFGLGQAAMGGQ